MTSASLSASSKTGERLLLAVALMVPLSIGLAVIWREVMRPHEVVSKPAERAARDEGRNTSSTVSISELAGTYSGWTRKTNGITDLMVLRIFDARAGGEFNYTLNVGRYRQDGMGALSDDGGVTFGAFRGRVEGFNDSVKMQSSPPDQLPIWQLSGHRSSSPIEDR